MFKVQLDNQPERFLKKADKALKERISTKIIALQHEPFPHDAKRIVNRKEKTFRIRVGDYRMMYVVYFEENTILISKIDKRENIY
mgnify:CR=1 FL=1